MALTIESLAPILQGIGQGVTSVMRAQANRDAKQAELSKERSSQQNATLKEFKQGELINGTTDKNLKGMWKKVPKYSEFGDPIMIYDKEGVVTGEQQTESRWVAHNEDIQKKNYSAAGWDWTTKRYVGPSSPPQTVEDAGKQTSTFTDNEKIKRTKYEFSGGGGTGNAAETPSSFRTNESGQPSYIDVEDGQEVIVQPNELPFMRIPITKPEDAHDAIEGVLLDELGKINGGQLDVGDASDMTRTYKAMSDSTGTNEKGLSKSRVVNEWYQMLVDRMAQSRIQAGSNDTMAFEATVDAVSPDELTAGADFIIALNSGDEGTVQDMLNQAKDKMAAEYKELVKSVKNAAMPIDFDETMAETKTPYEDPSHVVNFMKRAQLEKERGAEAPQSINEIRSTPLTQLFDGIQTDVKMGKTKGERDSIRKNKLAVDKIKKDFKYYGNIAVKNNFGDEFAMFTEFYKNENTAPNQIIPATPTKQEFGLMVRLMAEYKRGNQEAVSKLVQKAQAGLMRSQKVSNRNRDTQKKMGKFLQTTEEPFDGSSLSSYMKTRPEKVTPPDNAAKNVLKFFIPWLRLQSSQKRPQGVPQESQSDFQGPSRDLANGI